jgi:hypothetical protein
MSSTDPDCARHRRPEPTGASTFGLSAAELSAEVASRRLDGWRTWELRARFVDPRELVA